jgi:diguanylate cyclase (GGDEF)-like protein
MDSQIENNEAIHVREEQILADQVAALYSQVIPSMIGNLAIGLLTTILFYNKIDQGLLLSWFAVVVAINLGRGALALAYNSTTVPIEEALRWMRYFLIGVLMSGMAWGSTCLLFAGTLEHEQHYVLGFILGGLAGGAAPILASVRGAYILFLLTTMVPVVLMLLRQGDLTSQTMAGMFTVFILIMLMTAIRIHRLMRDSIVLRHQLDHMAHIDQLTGIPNRRSFDEHLELEWGRARREQYPLSLIMIDIDHFKPFNDNLGHQAGDVALQKVAKILHAEARRPGDIAARFGGEEFGLLLPHTDKTGAGEIAEHLRRNIQTLAIPHPAAPRAYLTISLGISCAKPSCGHSLDELISQADAALYEAKAAGRDRIEIYAASRTPRKAFSNELCPDAGQLE